MRPGPLAQTSLLDPRCARCPNRSCKPGCPRFEKEGRGKREPSLDLVEEGLGVVGAEVVDAVADPEVEVEALLGEEVQRIRVHRRRRRRVHVLNATTIVTSVGAEEEGWEKP